MIYVTQLIDVINTKSRLIVAGFSEVEATSMYGVLATQYTKVLFIPVVFATALARPSSRQFQRLLRSMTGFC